MALASPGYNQDYCCQVGILDKNPMTLFLLEITNTILSSTDIVFHIVYKREKTYSLVGEWGGACAFVCIYMESVYIYKWTEL